MPPSLLSPAPRLAGRGPGCSGDTMLTDTASVKIRVFLVWLLLLLPAQPRSAAAPSQQAGTSSQRCRHGRWVRTHTPAMHATCWDILSNCNNFFPILTTECHINVNSRRSKIYSNAKGLNNFPLPLRCLIFVCLTLKLSTLKLAWPSPTFKVNVDNTCKCMSKR